MCALRVPAVLVRDSKSWDRLEFVRKQKGYKNLREFWKGLTAGGGYAISYEAVRTYHKDRVPPARYYARVTDLTGAKLEWLISGGIGPAWEAEYLAEVYEADRAFWPLDDDEEVGWTAEHIPFFWKLRTPAKLAFVDAWGRLSENAGQQGRDREVGERLSQFALAPFVTGAEVDFSDAAFSDYVMQILGATLAVVARSGAE